MVVGVPLLVSRMQVPAGQGELWLAKSADPWAPEPVVKFLVINSDPEVAEQDKKRFAREVRCQSTLQHPGIMPILQYGLEGGRPWYSMPRADATLSDLIDRRPLSSDQLAPVIFPVLDALEYAHSEGVLHRDIKPANILHLPWPHSSGSGWVVADFGLCRDRRSASSRITQVQSRVGTVEYMAPEQFDDAHEVGVTADIYSLGRVLAHCLTGRVQFPMTRWNEIPEQLRHAVRRCSAEDPAERYQCIGDLRADLLALMAQGDNLTNPLEEARRILGLISATGSTAQLVAQFVGLLAAKSSNEFLYIQLMPEVGPQLVAEMCRLHPDVSSDIFRQFDRYAGGSFTFSYTDHVARFFEYVYNATADEGVRRLALRRILLIGYSHHRFFVRDTFCRLASAATGPTVVMISALLREEPEAARFLTESTYTFSYAPLIQSTLDSLRTPG